MALASKLSIPATPRTAYNIERIRKDFPILSTRIRDKPLVYLDNAATSQKPFQVIEALQRFHSEENSNIHRGIHYLSERATESYEQVRKKVARFLNAESESEIVFVRGTTEAINLVAQTYGRSKMKPGDEILVSHMEHHSNIVPWQLLCEAIGTVLKVIPINDRGELLMDEFEKQLCPRTKMIALCHISNALGTINPIAEIIERAHAKNIPVLIDGAQAAPHVPLDVRKLDVDFYAFSGHKLYGPTGIGVLYGKKEWLEQLPPYQGGGNMIQSVTFDKTTYMPPPFRFEAGTPNIAGGMGLGAAIDYVTHLGLDAISEHEHQLLAYGTKLLSSISGLRWIGEAKEKAGVLSFVLEGIHPHDVGTILDQEGIAIRAGHHCAQPVMQRFGVPATARASIGLYNTREEIDVLAAGIQKVIEVFR